MIVAFVVEGFCRGVSRGQHVLQLEVISCIFINNNFAMDILTGSSWTQIRVFVEEIREGSTKIAGEEHIFTLSGQSLKCGSATTPPTKHLQEPTATFTH